MQKSSSYFQKIASFSKKGLLIKFLLAILAISIVDSELYAQGDTHKKSLEEVEESERLNTYNQILLEEEALRMSDSLKEEILRLKLNQAEGSAQKEKIQQAIDQIEKRQRARASQYQRLLEQFKEVEHGAPVIGTKGDTLFMLYTTVEEKTAAQRALETSNRIAMLSEDMLINTDSIVVNQNGDDYEIVYQGQHIVKVPKISILWQGRSAKQTVETFRERIATSIDEVKQDGFQERIFHGALLAVLVIIIASVMILLVRFLSRRCSAFLDKKKESWLKDLKYKGYTFLSIEQELAILVLLGRIFRWGIYLLIAYITLPIIFSMFPFSRTWADVLFSLVWDPFKGMLIGIWDYLPNLFSIAVICFVLRWVVKLAHYFFNEIKLEKLHISGFHADWAMPTYSIVRFLLYAFMFVLIFPHLPGSDSEIFKGVSVFLGVLVSLGSSSAVANMIAGLVITYMRPFKLGDRIRIEDVSGDVVEKTLLVTRIKTIKNELITIPNSSVLTKSTTNYSSEAVESGLIVHTTITLGYDTPWQDVHEALVEAALRADFIQKEPSPFVLQTSLDDYYVSYQLNAYTKEASKQAFIYSVLHQNIQDVCNERSIEILSPHYRAARDGNQTTIPQKYLPEDYKTPAFHVRIKNADEN